MSIGARIKNHRTEKGLTQLELAVAAGVTPATVNRVEMARSEPSLRTVRKLAKALSLEVADLVA